MSIFESDSDYDSTASQESVIKCHENTIFFVKSEYESPLMAEAFNVCQTDPNVDNQWIKTKDLLNWHQFKDGFFVINCFNDNLFSYLNERKARIVGPTVIIAIYSNQSFNGLSTNCFKCHPIINKCMEESFVCIKIKDQKRKQHLIKLIEYMSGVYCRRLTSIVTLLIVDSIQTELHQKALIYGIPVVTEEWVYKCWRDSTHKIFNANHESIVNRFLVPLFKRVSMSNKIVLIADHSVTLNSSQINTKNMANASQEDGLKWIYFDSKSNERPTNVEEDIKPEEYKQTKVDSQDANHSDGMDWIDFDWKTVVMEPFQNANDYPNDNLSWLHFEDSTHSVTNISNIVETKPQLFTPEMKNKRKADDNKNKTIIENKSQKQKMVFNNNEMPVIFNLCEFEGMPSQRPYYRI